MADSREGAEKLDTPPVTGKRVISLTAGEPKMACPSPENSVSDLKNTTFSSPKIGQILIKRGFPQDHKDFGRPSVRLIATKGPPSLFGLSCGAL